MEKTQVTLRQVFDDLSLKTIPGKPISYGLLRRLVEYHAVVYNPIRFRTRGLELDGTVEIIHSGGRDPSKTRVWAYVGYQSRLESFGSYVFHPANEEE